MLAKGTESILADEGQEAEATPEKGQDTIQWSDRMFQLRWVACIVGCPVYLPRPHARASLRGTIAIFLGEEDGKEGVEVADEVT